MGSFVLFLAAALLSVGQDQAPLRTGCEEGDEVVAKLAVGTPVTVRFAINGCYAVRAGERDGFLAASALAGLERWEAERRQARDMDTRLGAGPVVTAPGADPIARASQLLANNRPGEALGVLERELQRAPRDASLLGLAGLAALRANATVRAIGYLKDAQAVRPDPSVAALLAKAEKEAAADQGAQTLETTRFSLRYEPGVVSAESARGLAAVMEQELSRISFELGCQLPERLSATAQSREAYRKATGAAEWSGGQFDGRIRVAVMGAEQETRQTLAHELVHACLGATGSWPAWFHEGLAQRLSGEVSTEPVRQMVRAAARSGGLPALGRMGQTWSRMSAEHARLAYATALYAVELFFEHHKEFGIRTLIRNPEYLGRISLDLDRRLRE